MCIYGSSQGSMSDYIPNELIIEILVRLPVQSLLRFTSVCKSWHSLITNPSFIIKHLNQTITDRKRNSDKLLLRLCPDYDEKEHYLLCSDDEKFGDDYSEFEFPFKSLIGCFRIVGSCNGLLCLCDDYVGDTHHIVLWNPSIRKSVTLPMPCKPRGPYMFVLGFGAHRMTHEHKVVRIVYEKEHINRFKVPPKVELYTQGIGSWREIDSAAAPPYCMVEFMWSQAFVNGAVHWVAYDPSVVGGFRNLIVSFDMVSEGFSEMMIPPALAGWHPMCLSIKLFGESLALFCGAETGRYSCCIWVMKEYGVAESWTKLFSINLPGVLNKTLGFRQNGEVLLSTTNNWLISYDPGTKTMSNTGIRGSSYSFNVDTFMETLILVKEHTNVLEGQLNHL
ncbi:hypothetical protein ACSBR1_012462 [Camellia fascicularis]